MLNPMAESMVLFQTALTEFASFTGVLKTGPGKWLLSFTVLTEPGNFRLVIQATDGNVNMWESRLAASDLQAHQSDLGLEHVDWPMYFKLLKSALTEKRVSLHPAADDLVLELEYPLAQAKLRGSLRIRKAPGSGESGIKGFMMGCIERLLEPRENLKRERPPSPELRDPQRIPPVMVKPPVKKHKKVKELGSKIA